MSISLVTFNPKLTAMALPGPQLPLSAPPGWSHFL